jgi:pyridoxal phosphate enzyme (YggS family)
MKDARSQELAVKLRAVRARLAAACAHANRKPDEVTLVAVTKTFPAEDVARLAELGVLDVGENRDQEAAPKAAAVAAAGANVHWHFIGQLQRNKARSVVRYADLVHSVDSVRLARALADAVHQHRETPLDVLVQISLDGARGGALPGDPDADVNLDRVLESAATSEHLRLRGVMAVAPLEWQPERAFARLAELAEAVERAYPQATIRSAGMSGDAEAAIDYGATHVRIGSALLGNRPQPHVT